MYIIIVKTIASEWHYGPFDSMQRAKEAALFYSLEEGTYKIIQLIPMY